jgi:hypothetical protein
MQRHFTTIVSLAITSISISIICSISFIVLTEWAEYRLDQRINYIEHTSNY